MNLAAVDKIARAVLYEGYVLYPYRASAVKNRQRFTFGGLYPRSYSVSQAGSEPWQMRTECLVVARADTKIELRVRFLHLLAREVVPAVDSGEFVADTAGNGAAASGQVLDSLEIDGRVYQTWQEAVEREVVLTDLLPGDITREPVCRRFSFGSLLEMEPLTDRAGRLVAFRRRRQREVNGAVDVVATPLENGLFRLRVTISNLTGLADFETAGRDEAQLHALASTHTVVALDGGEFVSLLDPPDEFREAAAGCENVGTWPVLVGAAGDRDLLLSSPIILYDYPQIAPESPGALFDSTEIDEILSLRIMTLTDAEKREMADLDPHCRELLERVTALSAEQLMSLHGAMRDVL